MSDNSNKNIEQAFQTLSAYCSERMKAVHKNEAALADGASLNSQEELHVLKDAGLRAYDFKSILKQAFYDNVTNLGLNEKYHVEYFNQWFQQAASEFINSYEEGLLFLERNIIKSVKLKQEFMARHSVEEKKIYEWMNAEFQKLANNPAHPAVDASKLGVATIISKIKGMEKLDEAAKSMESYWMIAEIFEAKKQEFLRRQYIALSQCCKDMLKRIPFREAIANRTAITTQLKKRQDALRDIPEKVFPQVMKYFQETEEQEMNRRDGHHPAGEKAKLRATVAAVSQESSHTSLQDAFTEQFKQRALFAIERSGTARDARKLVDAFMNAFGENGITREDITRIHDAFTKYHDEPKAIKAQIDNLMAKKPINPVECYELCKRINAIQNFACMPKGINKNEDSAADKSWYYDEFGNHNAPEIKYNLFQYFLNELQKHQVLEADDANKLPEEVKYIDPSKMLEEKVKYIINKMQQESRQKTKTLLHIDPYRATLNPIVLRKELSVNSSEKHETPKKDEKLSDERTPKTPGSQNAKKRLKR
jgi:hypothetical protein